MRAARDMFLDRDRTPASSLVKVDGLFQPDLLIEIEAVAAPMASSNQTTSQPGIAQNDIPAITNQKEAQMPVVRISKGHFPVKAADEVQRLLNESEAVLREPLEQLHGLLHYYVGIDPELGYISNVSIWETAADAHQMDTLQAMLAQRPLLEAAGVVFEPITNHQALWELVPTSE